MITRKISIYLFFFLTLSANIAVSQVNTFPYSESFEQTFTEGNNVVFITNWTGNQVDDNSRIYQGTNARTGTNSLNVIPTSSFSGEILISLDLTGISNPKMSFYAFSRQNGSTSTRPALVSVATSIDEGTTFLDNVSIGDETTFPNDNTTSYTRYEYELPVTASGESNVVIKMSVARGSGSGSTAEFVMDDLTIEEQSIPLAISSINAPGSTSVVVTFNQEVTQNTAETIGNYAIDNSISVTAASRTAINEVTLTTSTMANNNYNLTVNGVEDAASNTPASNLQEAFSFVESLAIASTTVTSKNTLELIFNLDLNQASAETLTNYSIDNSIGNPTGASLDATNRKKVILTLGTDLVENNYQVTVNGVTDESTLAAASNLTGNFSYLPLAINSITASSATELLVTFNQDVETTNAETTSNYALNFSFGSPATASQSGTNAAVVTLTFTSSLVNNTYELTVNNITNTSGNATASGITGNVTFSTATLSRQIVINEIYVDPNGANQPDPQVLPGGSGDEFIELYNASPKDIDLAYFDLSGGTVGSHVLAPGAFVILTSSGNVSDFQGFGNTVAVSSWNSLTNSGEQLTLKDNLGNLVDSLTYDLTWYRDDEKADGGWTLEQINPDLTCSDANNWIASTDARGGSPGGQNSVFDNTPDTTGPSLISVNPSSPTTLQVTFNEVMDEISLTNGTFTLDNGLTVASSVPVTPSLRATTLTLTSAMTSGTVYELTVSGVTDCSGNAVAIGTLGFLFDNEAPVFERFVVKDLQTVDLIFDEALDENIAETESNYSVDQSIGNPENATISSTDAKRISLSFGQNLSTSTDYVFSYDHLADTLGNAVGSSMETLNFTNAIDSIVVNSSQLLDVYFTEAVQTTPAETTANYIVDNSIGSPKTALQDDDNHKLVHLVFENSFDDNRDLIISFENIRNSGGNFVQALNTVFVYDTDRPGIDSVGVIDQSNLMVYFDEAVDLSSAEAINNYTANNDLGNPTTVIRQADLKSVQLTFSGNFTNEQVNRLSISGIRDLAQNQLSSTRNFDFTFDELAPSLSTVEVLSPKELLVTFSEVVDRTVAETLATYSIDNGIGNPSTATRNARDSSKVNLVFSGFGNHATNTLTITGMKDGNGNVTPTDLTSDFASNQPTNGSLVALTDTTLLLTMTKELTQASAEDANSYGLDNGLDVKSAAQDATNSYQVVLTLTAAMTEDTAYALNITSLTDTDGNTANDLATSLTYDSQLASLNLVNENTLKLLFDHELLEANVETAGNFEISDAIGNPVSAVLDTEESKTITLIFGTDLVEDTNYMLYISGLKDSFGDDIPASSHALVYDVTAPTIASVSSTFTNQITITFSESVDETSAETLNHFSLDNGIGNPSALELQSSGNEVLLTFSTDLTDATDYQLTVDRVEDLKGNTISAATTNFTFAAPIEPDFRDLVINEIYPDPDVSSPLPDAEYIEIYNAGSDAIKLRNFTISDNSSTATLKIFELAANDHLVLTSTANEGLFSGNVMGLASFPSLSNTGETLYFKRRDGTVVDSLSYSLEFYNDESKQDGGFTIELINPSAPCFDPANYAASNSANQGTPGAQNSVFDNTTDTTSPEVTGVAVISETQLRVTFNESMDVGSIQATDFTVSSGVSVSSISLEDEFGTSVLVNLPEAFEKGVLLNLVVANLTDCAGNTIASNSTPFFLGATPATHELIITEIMANPTPSQGLPEVEYLEVYNASTKILSIDGLSLSDRSSTTTLPDIDIQPEAYLFLTSTGNVGQFSGIEVVGVPSLPSLNISGDSLAIAKGTDLIFDVVYTTNFYGDETKAAGGYSLEMISPTKPCFDDANWTASNDTDGGTPGTQNSVFDNTADTTAPELVSIEVTGDRQFQVAFNESMDVGSIAASDFTFSNSLQANSVTTVGEFGTTVRVNLNANIPRGNRFDITLAGVNDCSGNTMSPVSRAFVLGDIPTPGQLVITEIMADPSPSQGLPEVDYLEILNVSNITLNLQSLTLSDRSTSTPLSSIDIGPGEYHVLTTNEGATQIPGATGVSGFPSLNSSGDLVAISQGSKIIASVTYSDDWFRDNAKAQGGVSLEMIDVNFPCLEAVNWRGSDASNGGTPGSLNSVAESNPDVIGPRLLQAVALNTQQILLTYDEKLEVETITTNSFQISAGITVSSFFFDETQRLVTLTTNQSLQSNTLYTITTDNVTDCSGNLIQDGFDTEELVVALEGEAGDLLVNEILFNPRSGGVRFVEFYNHSTKFLNLKNWVLAGATNERLITEEELIVSPDAYLVLTTDGDILASEYPGTVSEVVFEMSALPSFANSSGSVSLFNPLGDLVDLFEYAASFHSSLLDNVDGVSLERIRFASASNDPNNWQSASSTTGFATPGYSNSQAQEAPGQVIPNDAVLVEPRTFAPDVAGMAAFTTINFEFDNPGNVINLKVYDANGQLVKDIAQNALVGTEGFFRWDGTRQNGSKARVGYYMILLEVIAPDGTVSIKKERIAIGSRL